MSDILVVDDEKDIRELVSDILGDEGYNTRTAGNSDSALAELNESTPGLVILDIWLKDSKMDGIDILNHIKSTMPNIPVVIISGHGNIEIAVAAIKQGAYDFIEKPFNIDQLMVIVKRAMETSKLRGENLELRKNTGDTIDLIGSSALFKTLISTVDRVTKSNGRIMLTGPVGSGKERFAQYIHANSNRNTAPFIVLNCASLDSQTADEEIFGTQTTDNRVKTGYLDAANGGTLFISDVDYLPLDTQSKILRALVDNSFTRIGGQKTHDIDIRIISGTTKDLNEKIEAGQFREELFHRLNVVPVNIPSLEERREDIPELANFLMQQISEEQGLPMRSFADDAMTILQSMTWPGNVRQLRNIIERLLILGDPNKTIECDELPDVSAASESQDGRIVLSGNLATLSLREARELFEREYLLTQISRFGGNISRTASFVGMERSALHRKLKSLGVVTSNKSAND